MDMDSSLPQLSVPLLFVSHCLHQVFVLYLPLHLLPLPLSLRQIVSLNVDGAGWHNPNHEIFRGLRERLGKVSLTWTSRDFPFLLNLYLLWRLCAALWRPAALLRRLATVVRPFLLTHDIFPHASASQTVVLKVHFTGSCRKSPFASWTRFSSHHPNYTCFHQNLFSPWVSSAVGRGERYGTQTHTDTYIYNMQTLHKQDCLELLPV